MKKLLLTLAMVFIATSVMAGTLDLGDIVKKLPLKQGIAYSLEDSNFNYLSTLEVANYKNVALEVGYAGAADETKHKFVGVVSYPIVALKDYVNVPVIDLVELNLGVWAGLGKIGDAENEFDYGISATLIEVKF